MFKLPSEKLQRIRKTQRTRVPRTTKGGFRPIASANLHTNGLSTPPPKRSDTQLAVSKSRKRQILRDDLQSVRDTKSELEAAEQEAKEQLEVHTEAARAKKIALDNSQAEMRRLEEKIQSAERESEELEEQQHRSEVEVRRLQGQLKRIAEVETVKVEVLRSHE